MSWSLARMSSWVMGRSPGTALAPRLTAAPLLASPAPPPSDLPARRPADDERHEHHEVRHPRPVAVEVAVGLGLERPQRGDREEHDADADHHGAEQAPHDEAAAGRDRAE